VLAFALDLRLVALLQPFVAAIAWMLHRLRAAADSRSEQIAIGLGARLGNGLLLCALAWSILDGSGATTSEALGLTAAIAAAFLLSFAALAAEPQQAIIGYKG
jgi:hypothetical protein